MSADPSVNYLGIEQGLSNNAVTCIYQDKQGFMWFGTFDGLNRFDGYNFMSFRKNLKDSLSLTDNHISVVREDKLQNLWIGTSQGLSIYQRLTEKFKPFYIKGKNGQVTRLTNEVSSIEITAEGDVIVAAQASGLIVLNQKSGFGEQVPFQSASGNTYNYVARLVKQAPDGQVWVYLAEKGLCRFDKKDNIIKLIVPTVAFANITIATHKDGRIWVGTRSGLLEYNSKSGITKWYNQKNSKISHYNVAGLCVMNDGNLWIGTDGAGVNILNTATGDFKLLETTIPGKRLTSPSVYSLYQDRDKRIWIGTLRGGINIIDPLKNQFNSIAFDARNSNSLINNFVLSFCEENPQTLWVGTDGGGLSIWNRSQNKFQNLKHQPEDPQSISSNFITAILKDNNSQMWIGTFDGGINRYVPSTQSFRKYECKNPVTGRVYPHVWTLYQDKNKTLWAGLVNGGGLFRYNAVTDDFELFDNSIESIISMGEDNKGSLWAGTYDELVKIDRFNKRHRFVEIGSPVRDILFSKQNQLWIGTESNGLLKMNSDLKGFEAFTKSEGLPNNAVLRLLEDAKGNLWISTFYGLSRFNPVSKNFQNFFESDGLQSNQFNYNAAIASQNGQMYFGGINGFNSFYPDSITVRKDMPALQVTGITISNQPVQANTAFISKASSSIIQQIRLPFGKAAVSVEFAALEYSSPDKISYAYYLDGWDKGWNYVGHSRTATYTRLDEGHYKLRIKSSNTEGEWNKDETILNIIILPPWYRTWWAFACYLLIAVIATYLYVSYKSKQRRLEYEVKVAHIAAEKEKDLNEKKLTFFTNISHEFRTPLTLIINPVKDLLYRKDKAVDASELNIVYRNARRLLSLVDQLLLFRKAGSEADYLKVSVTDISVLCYEVFLCFTQQAGSKNIRYSFEGVDAGVYLYVDREKIEIALFNLISNAIKYSPVNGRVHVNVSAKQNGCCIEVSDSGPGIPAQTGARLFEKFYQVKEIATETGFGIGLYVARTFVNHHKGNIGYRNLPGAGTCFFIELKSGKEHFDANTVFEDSSGKSGFIRELVQETTSGDEPVLTNNRADIVSGGLVTDERSLLVVDDNEEIRQYITQIFRYHFKVITAPSAEEGLTLARQFLPDIIISDVIMEGISGIEMCGLVKKDPALSHIPVILLTASSAAEVKLKGIEGGADDYITKPFEKELLVARIENLLKKRNVLQQYFYNAITLQENDIRISEEYKQFLEKCMAIVEENIDRDDFSIKFLAAEIGMSHSKLYKKVKSVSGQSVSAFIRFIRLRKAAELFIHSQLNISETAFQVGISDTRYFRDQFNQLFGMNPSDYIKKYRKPFQKKYNLNEQVRKDPTVNG